MEADAAKGVSIGLLFTLTVVFGCVPVWLHRRGTLTATGSPRRRQVLDVLTCFSGGVFLGTCLLHLLAEGREEMEAYKEKVGVHSDFPMFETLAAVGLFLIAYFEKIGFGLLSFSKRKNTPAEGRTTANGKGPGPRVDHSPVNHGPVTRVTYGTMSQEDISIVDSSAKTGSRPASNGSHSSKNTATTCLSNGQEECSVSVMALTDSDVAHQPHDLPEKDHHQHHHHHHSIMESTSCQPSDISQMSVMRALLLLLALSFHTIFDGLAVGLQDSANEVWEVLLAIAIHKSLVAFCLGLELAAAYPNKMWRPTASMLLFALISPIGIAIGIGVTSGGVDETAQLLASSILQALATGTFLYVTFFEILGQNFAHSHGEDGGAASICVELLKVTVTVIGFACMAGVKLLDKD